MMKGMKTVGRPQWTVVHNIAYKVGGASTLMGGMGKGESWCIVVRMVKKSKSAVMIKMFVPLDSSYMKAWSGDKQDGDIGSTYSTS